MGKLFLILLLLACLFLPASWSRAQGRIELMPDPVPILPPNVSEESYQDDLQRKREERHKRDAPSQIKSSPTERRNRLLSKESAKPRPYQLMSQVSLIVPTVFTRGSRKDYTTEITSHFTISLRLAKQSKPGQAQLWSGFRLAPFAGTGTYEKTPGRYGFIYFGPMIGLGKINLSEEDTDTAESADKGKDGQQEFIRRTGWFLMSGIAAQSRAADTEESNETVDRDFNTVRGAKFDGTGLWVELTYSVIHFGAVGTHYVTGLQLGEGKAFVWAGVAAAAWY